MKYILSVLVENQPGVLSRVTSLFARRGYNIDSLTVSISEDPTLSLITIVGEGDDYTIEQMEKQLNKLIPVIKVRQLGGKVNVVRGELVFVKVAYEKQHLSEIAQIVQLMNAEVVNVSTMSVTVKFAGEHQRCDTLCELLRPFGIRKIVRSGIIAMDSE